MSDPLSIPGLWSPGEVSVGEDGYLWIVAKEQNDSIRNDDDDKEEGEENPPLLATTLVVLQTLYPSLTTKQILAMENCYLMEEETEQGFPKFEQDVSLVIANKESTTPSPQVDGHVNVSNNNDDGNLTHPHTDMKTEPVQTESSSSKREDNCGKNAKSKPSNQYQQIYQTLIQIDNLSNRIENALTDIQICRHRRLSGRTNRYSHRSREETKVKALEHQQKRLLAKRSTSTAENSDTNQNGDSTNDTNENQNNGDGNDDGDNNDDDDTKDTAHQEPQLVRLVRTLNSIRALFPHLLPITNHKRRNDKNLVIGKTRYKEKKKGSMCWLLGTQIYDSTTCKRCVAFHDDMGRVLEGYIDKNIAQRISIDSKGGPHSFWSRLWVQELVTRSTPTMVKPSTLVSTITGQGTSEILAWAKKWDNNILALEQQSNRTMKQLYLKSVDKLHNRLSKILGARFKGARISIYGSCLSDLSLGKGSDVDLSLYTPELKELKDSFQQGTVNAREYERIMKKSVYQAHRQLMNLRSEFCDVNAIVKATIPVITGTYKFADNPYTEDGSIE
jgi:hypothetical protein